MKSLFLPAARAMLMLALAGWLAGCAPMPPLQAAAAPAPETNTTVEAAPGDAVASAAAVDESALQKITRSPWNASGQKVAWTHFGVPGKQATRFAYEHIDGRHAVSAYSQSSASLLRKAVRVEPPHLGHIQFSWKVPALIAGADMSRRDKDDSPVRIVLAFDGDRSRFSVRDAVLAELTRAITGEEMPYATLMYVWGNHTPVGGVISNPRTDRIRKFVLESGPGSLGRWMDYERDVRADYERVFGEAPGALIGVAIMTDSDNTRTSARAWYGPVELLTRPMPAAGSRASR